MNYRAYIRSEAWRRKTRKVHQRSGYRCERCGASGRRLEVHHKTYRRLGRERMSDLIDLCDQCHDYVHGRSDYDPRQAARGFLGRTLVSVLRKVVQGAIQHSAPGRH